MALARSIKSSRFQTPFSGVAAVGDEGFDSIKVRLGQAPPAALIRAAFSSVRIPTAIK